MDLVEFPFLEPRREGFSLQFRDGQTEVQMEDETRREDLILLNSHPSAYKVIASCNWIFFSFQNFYCVQLPFSKVLFRNLLSH